MALPKDLKFVTFDCYGTLIDWETGVYEAFQKEADRDGFTVDREAVVRRFVEVQRDIQRGSYELYAEVLRRTAVRVAAELGWDLEPSRSNFLPNSVPYWQPFPDTRPALAKLREAGGKLAIISNTDEAIIAQTLRHLEVPFDAVITAESCGAYKPDPTVFAQSQGRLGVAPERILHVAFGFKYDIGPAQDAGWHSAWINRYAETKPGPATPDHEWRDLWGLAKFFGAAVPE